LTVAGIGHKFCTGKHSEIIADLIASLMKILDRQQRTEMLDRLLSLAISCPVDQSNPANCPLCNVRKMDLGRRLEWFRSLTDDELVFLNSYHHVCMKHRLQELLVAACH
jgi:hypothetical protein